MRRRTCDSGAADGLRFVCKNSLDIGVATKAALEILHNGNSVNIIVFERGILMRKLKKLLSLLISTAQRRQDGRRRSF